MPRTRRLLSFISLVFPLTFVLSAQAAQVTVSGRKLLVDGVPFVIKGVNYSPTRAGSRIDLDSPTSYNVFADTQTWLNDFPLLKAMGVNTLRLSHAVNATQGFLDAAQQNGFHVVMGYSVNDRWNAADASTQAVVKAQVRAMVSAWKDHPAVLMWSIGNEETGPQLPAIGALSDSGRLSWYNFLNNDLAALVKGIDANHPITTAIVDVGDIGKTAFGTMDSNLPNVDLWGANIYRGPSFGDAFSVLAATTSKPVWFSEFGSDAYNSVAGREDQEQQASDISAQWMEINRNLSATGAGILAGGCVFSWSDEWWKGAGATGGAGGDFVQDTAVDWTNPAYADPGINEEWWGIVAITSGTSQPAKRLRQAYYALRDLWTPSTIVDSGSVFSGSVINAPNPFPPGGTTTLYIPIDGTADSVSAVVFDEAYHKVSDLVVNPAQNAHGNYAAVWNGRDSNGNMVSPGVYVVRVEASARRRDAVKYRKVVVVP